ncbi:hypothetical protein F7H86_11935 [Novacetimonas hansenii]
MFVSGNTSPCHHSLHLFAKTDESQHAGIVQKLSDQALRQHSSVSLCSEVLYVRQTRRPTQGPYTRRCRFLG